MGTWDQVIEPSVEALTAVPLFARGKFVLLRLCNALLRRLSKTRDTEFCGRVLLFLAAACVLSCTIVTLSLVVRRRFRRRRCGCRRHRGRCRRRRCRGRRRRATPRKSVRDATTTAPPDRDQPLSMPPTARDVLDGGRAPGRSYPLSERSAVNVGGKVHSSNVTDFEDEVRSK